MREKEHSRHELVMPQSLHPLALRERGVCVCMRWHPGTYMDAHGHECVMESDVVRHVACNASSVLTAGGG